MKFRFDFPAGWKTETRRQWWEPSSQPGCPDRHQFGEGYIAAGGRLRVLLSARPRLEGTVQTEEWNLEGPVTFHALDSTLFQILGYGTQQAWWGLASAVPPSTVSLETLAIINGVEKGGRLSAGQKAKQVVGQKLQ
jgi:hypothetical protein